MQWGAVEAPSPAERYYHLLSAPVCQAEGVWLAVPELNVSITYLRGAEDQNRTEGAVSKCSEMRCQTTLASRTVSPGWLLRLSCIWWRLYFNYQFFFDALLWMSMNMFILVPWCSAWGKWLYPEVRATFSCSSNWDFVWRVHLFLFASSEDERSFSSSRSQELHNYIFNCSSPVSATGADDGISQEAACVEMMGPLLTVSCPMQTEGGGVILERVEALVAWSKCSMKL